MKKDRTVLLKRVYKILNIVVIALLILFCALNFVNTIYKRIYPLLFKEEIISVSKEFELDALVVFSVVKIESDFNSFAVSNKNAKGLMQLTDSTAKFMADNLKIKQYDLFNEMDNLRLGCAYLRYLSDKFNDIEIVVCAYNAGEGNVKNWLKNQNYSVDGKALNEIPFEETKNYLQKFKKTFLKYDKLYRNILDKS